MSSICTMKGTPKAWSIWHCNQSWYVKEPYYAFFAQSAWKNSDFTITLSYENHYNASLSFTTE
jgi:hypothetical protein